MKLQLLYFETQKHQIFHILHKKRVYLILLSYIIDSFNQQYFFRVLIILIIPLCVSIMTIEW